MQKGFIRPKPLGKTKVIRILSPSGSMPDGMEGIQVFIDAAKAHNLDVELTLNALGQHGDYSAPAPVRLRELQAALDDDEVDAIIATRGGYGITHLLDQLDFTLFLQHPKWLIGFSDFTLLLLRLNQLGYCALHAPMARSFGLGDEASRLSLFSALKAKPQVVTASNGIFYKINLVEDTSVKGNGNMANSLSGGSTAAVNSTAPQKAKKLANQQHLALPVNQLDASDVNITSEGILLGGCLSLLAHSCGTTLAEVLKATPHILFIEDVNEKSYQIDRMLHQLGRSGLLKKTLAVCLGSFSDADPSVATATADHPNYEDVVAVIAAALAPYLAPNTPIIAGFPVGHQSNNATLVMGMVYSLDADIANGSATLSPIS